jgi:hypothetical protein
MLQRVNESITQDPEPDPKTDSRRGSEGRAREGRNTLFWVAITTR